jgi:hypothetical protein
MAQDWITRAVSSGLQKLILLNLEHAPALDVLAGGVLPAWVEAITTGKMLDESRDEPRIQAGFRALMAHCTSWPSPRQLMDAMPPLAAPRQPVRLEDDARRARGLESLRDIAQRMGFPQPGERA